KGSLQEENKDNNWQLHHGNSTRSRLMSANGNSFSSLAYFTIPEHIARLHRGTTMETDYYMASASPPRMFSESIPYFPVVGEGLIYLPTGLGVYVFELPSFAGASEDGSVDLSRPSPSRDGGYHREMKIKWKFEIPVDEKAPVFAEERTINTATLSTDNQRLFVPLISSFEKHDHKLGFLTVRYPFPRRTLFAFDTRTGRILWTTKDNPTDQQRANNLAVSPTGINSANLNPYQGFIFPVAPVEQDGVIYLAGIYMPNQVDVPEHHLFAINPRNGEVFFKTFIASGILEANLFNNASREPIAGAVTVDDDNIYYCSQMGVVATVDKYNGNLNWIKKYDQYYIPTTWPDYKPPRLPLRWVNNPIIYTECLSNEHTKGQIVVTAIDSPFLYVLAKENGKELWRWNADSIPLGNTRYLLGIKDELLIVSGKSNITCINLKKEGKIEWMVSGTGMNSKGGITDDRVFVSSSDHTIVEIGLKNGKRLKIHALYTEPFVPQDKLREGVGTKDVKPPPSLIETGYNLLLVGDFLIMNSLSKINIYRIQK
ncbi:MAG: PQQ-binding-like beta-propeller repeat protein, partial [Planctomycetota bacterium]|nr:PQQ-binding-like beta-propeller repeat protein [Planctomycetota bacterium]